jgi:hypothetical protein
LSEGFALVDVDLAKVFLDPEETRRGGGLFSLSADLAASVVEAARGVTDRVLADILLTFAIEQITRGLGTWGRRRRGRVGVAGYRGMGGLGDATESSTYRASG